MNPARMLPVPYFFPRHRARALLSLFLFLLVILAVFPAHGQQGGLNITGKITAQEDQQPVAHANVTIDRKGIATAANTAGRFALIIPAENLADTLKISCIGFKTKYLPIAAITASTALNITLEKNVITLKEVAVGYYDVAKIMQTAISRIPENYINHPHILRGFYRMYTYSDTFPLQLSEAVFDVYNFGYADKHADQFRLIKARNEKNTRDFSSVELGQDPNSVFEDDVINHRPASGFLSDEGLKKHVFKVLGVVDFQGYQAYEIDFEAKAGATDESFNGELFIDTRTYAFISFAFGSNATDLSDLGSANFISRALLSVGDATVTIKDDHTVVSYQEVGKQWVLAHVEGDHVVAFKNPGAATDLVAHIKFNYQVTAVDTVAKNPFGSKLGRNENINEHPSNDDPKFWKDYTILLPDEDTDAVFKQLQEINKAGKGK